MDSAETVPPGESMKSKKLGIVLILLCVAIAPLSAQTKVTKAEFGKLPDGSAVDVYTLADATLNIRIITFGAHVISVKARDRNGKIADVVLGYDTLAGYIADDKTYMGSVVGRYGNRIGKGQFTVGGEKAQLPLNNNGNTLHGGTTGFDRKNWTAKQVPNGVELTLVSPDGDMGFHGKLTASVKYTLTGDKLRIDYLATTDKATVVNLTNHSYFNLAGKGDILGDVLMIDADKYTPVDAGLIPTGELAPVAGTPFDFRTPTTVGARINTPNTQLKIAGGYDHNWVLNAPHTLANPAAVVTDPASGRTLKVFTLEPGVQFYSGNFLDGSFKGRDGAPYTRYSGLCLETQHYPDSPNHPDFPSTTVVPGKPYRTSTIFEFTVTK
jgi:aldose 1-epimerase